MNDNLVQSTFQNKTCRIIMTSQLCTLKSYFSSGSRLMYFSYNRPPSHGNISSLKRIMFLMSSFTWFWYWTWSLSSGTGTSVGPKQMARLYGSIMFSSQNSDKLQYKEKNQYTQHYRSVNQHE